MKHLIRSLLLLGLIAWLIPAQAGEVLRHMSDELAPAVTEPVNPAANDRRIIYRVICTPGGEVLPDCEKPYHDTESVAQPLPPDEVEPVATEQARPVEKTTQPAKSKKSKKTANKKNKAVKKAKKTTSKKKTAAKKK
ncbi:MAG: hypothetical protein M0R33_14345 [Methylomonas sp.]|jgi:hypothetical protein|uniref:hypothetical protein n=1 Tax=Methylomonas sp. TaxID=418 RepID=UPI0025FCBF5B|nr:hypothetical protein [Methylomonas sp.]MCK9607618.1 hypothetical protein [Methylomonas sp.]